MNAIDEMAADRCADHVAGGRRREPERVRGDDPQHRREPTRSHRRIARAECETNDAGRCPVRRSPSSSPRWPPGRPAPPRPAGRATPARLRAQVLTAPAIEPAVREPRRRATAGERRRRRRAAAAADRRVRLRRSPPAPRSRARSPGRAKDQIARARGAVADVGVASLPALPIPLPEPDFSDLDAVNIPGSAASTCGAALEALIPPRALPNLELLRVRAASAEASAAVRERRPALLRQLGARRRARQRARDRARARRLGDGPADRLRLDRSVRRRRLEDRQAARRRPRRAPARDPAGARPAPGDRDPRTRSRASA